MRVSYNARLQLGDGENKIRRNCSLFLHTSEQEGHREQPPRQWAFQSSNLLTSPENIIREANNSIIATLLDHGGTGDIKLKNDDFLSGNCPIRPWHEHSFPTSFPPSLCW